MPASKTILLTGATGFLGSHMLEALLKKHYNVVILKRSSSEIWRISHLMSQVKSYDVDVHTLDEIFSERIDTIVHLATFYRKQDSVQNLQAMLNSNVTLPAQLLEFGIQHGVKAFFNTGTFFEYDCSSQPIGESNAITPFNFYAKTKLAFEGLLETYAQQIVVNTFRLFSPYGEKDNNKLIPLIIRNALRGEKTNLSEGLQKLDFIYAADIISAYIKAIERSDGLSAEYEVFNLGAGSPISVREIVSIVEQILGHSIDKQWGETSKVDIPVAYADISKAKEILGWHPQYTLYQGLTNVIEYYKGESV